MFVVAVVSQKGGAGKTTIATNLAVLAERAGMVTAILDLDPQASAARWGDRRKGRPPEVIPAQASRLGKTLDDARGLGAEFVVIDTGPAADTAALEAAKLSDLVLVPVRPSALDLDALDATLTISALARRPTFVVINGVPASSRVGNDMEKALGEHEGVQIVPVRLGQRVDFSVPMAAGETTVEWAAKGRSASEIAALWAWLQQHVSKQHVANPTVKHVKTRQRSV
jgi:chromosome partitioning protein